MENYYVRDLTVIIIWHFTRLLVYKLYKSNPYFIKYIYFSRYLFSI